VTVVACVYRSGGPYRAEYVERLIEGVLLHWEGSDVACLTDRPREVEAFCDVHELRHDWPGWWSKIELFRVFTGPTLYLDLDTVVTGDLSDIVAQADRAPFTMLSDFFSPAEAQSGVMACSGDWRVIYERFAADPGGAMALHGRRPFFGDGGFVATQVPGAERWQDVLPGQVVSRKLKATRNANERLVCFHGQPRPAEVGWQV
jgi:hypothetical protein